MSMFNTLSPSIPSLNLTPPPPIPIHHHRRRRRTTITTPNSKPPNSADIPDRLISAACYFYPFFDSIHYNKYLITQFPILQTLTQPLLPSIRAFKTFPLNGFLVFLTLYFLIVRNPSFSKYVRFNTMQVVVLDVLLIVPDLLEMGWDPKDGVGLDVLMGVDSGVFLFMLVCLIYGLCCCFLGLVPRLPIVAEVADREVM